MNTPSLSRRGLMVAALLWTSLCFSQTPPPAGLLPYRDVSLSVEQRIGDLLGRMTLEEKIAQLQCIIRKPEWGKNFGENGLGGVGPALRSLTAGKAASAVNGIQRMALERTRLGIPVLFHDEGLHGLVGNKATSFPQAIGLAATWDTDLVARVAAATARESRSRGIRQLLSPVVNIARDVRWGRVQETYGEDPYLSGAMGAAFCRSLEKESVVSTPKHFVANAGDGGRDSYPISFSERELREVYFPPFEACIREGGARSVMAAYNSLDGIPCSANRWLLTDLLRDEWGFRGMVVSDYESVEWIADRHEAAADWKGAAALALESGLDMELPEPDCFGRPLLEAVKEGLCSVHAVDRAVRNVLRIKFGLGLFENPFADSTEAEKLNDSPGHRALAAEAARRAIVLLKNERNVLPLSGAIRSIAVLGPMADSVELGGYSGFGMECLTALGGIRRALPPSVRVTHARGCDAGFGSLPPVPSAVLRPPGGRPGQRGLKGEYFANRDLTGKPAMTRIDTLVRFTWAMGSPDPSLPREGFSVRWTGELVPESSGTYTFGVATDDGVRLWLDGSLLIDSWYDRGALPDRVTLVLQGGRAYDLKIEYYENTGWSYASLDWRLETGVDPAMDEAVALARGADVAVVAVGIIEGEGYDRTSLDLPGGQEELIRRVAATGTPTVVLLVTGNAVTMKGWFDAVPAIVQVWYGGEESGTAVADVLLGRVSPGGKLPVTFPRAVGQVPLFYDHRPTGRGDHYSDLSGLPLFPFGHGLSYTTFRYENLRVPTMRIPAGDTVSVSVDITNSGPVEGDEVVQLYLRFPVSVRSHPVKSLKGFRRITLTPGERRTVTFVLGPRELSWLGDDMKPAVGTGVFRVMAGSSSEDIRLRGAFAIARRQEGK